MLPLEDLRLQMWDGVAGRPTGYPRRVQVRGVNVAVTAYTRRIQGGDLHETGDQASKLVW